MVVILTLSLPKGKDLLLTAQIVRLLRFLFPN